MYDVLENKRRYRILNIIDDHNRECLCCEVSRSFGGYDVAEALDRLIDRYGKPKTIKSDNGSEFRSRYMEKWSKERGITLEFTSPGKGQRPFYGRRHSAALAGGRIPAEESI